MSNENVWIGDVQRLCETKNWRDILALGHYIPAEEKSRLLWVWPTERNLIFIKSIIADFKINGILSIGCGSGLLEWILQQSTGIPTAGIELDSSWWKSKYCTKPFISLNYIKSSIASEFLLKSISRTDWDFAILFCYFNNKPAFLEYVNAYKGSCLIIIGPLEGQGKHTDPTPFDLYAELENVWYLYNYSEVGNTKDFIAVYVRKTLL